MNKEREANEYNGAGIGNRHFFSISVQFHRISMSKSANKYVKLFVFFQN